VRWAELFRDLEAQLERAEADELAAEVADRTRREAARLRLVDRLLPALDRTIRLHVAGLGDVTGRVHLVAAEALLLTEPAGRQVLVPLDAILSLAGLTARSAAPGGQGEVFARLRLTSALRGLARDRANVRVVLRDAATLFGTIDRVGDDFLELAQHPTGEPRRRPDVSGVAVVPLRAIGAIVSL